MIIQTLKMMVRVIKRETETTVKGKVMTEHQVREIEVDIKIRIDSKVKTDLIRETIETKTLDISLIDLMMSLWRKTTLTIIRNLILSNKKEEVVSLIDIKSKMVNISHKDIGKIGLEMKLIRKTVTLTIRDKVMKREIIEVNMINNKIKMMVINLLVTEKTNLLLIMQTKIPVTEVRNSD